MASIKDSIKSLTSWVDFAPNLFEATAVFDKMEEKTGAGTTPLLITAINFSSGNLELQRHPLTRKFFLKNYIWEDTVTITWRETSTLAVYKYHINWLNVFYNKVTDSYNVGKPAGDLPRKRNLTVQLQKFTNPTTIGNADNGKITFTGVMPSSPLTLDLGWSKSSADGTTIQITYKFDSWSIT